LIEAPVDRIGDVADGVPGSTFTAVGDINDRCDVVGLAYTVTQC